MSTRESIAYDAWRDRVAEGIARDQEYAEDTLRDDGWVLEDEMDMWVKEGWEHVPYGEERRFVRVTYGYADEMYG